MRDRSRSACLVVFALLVSLCSVAATPLAASAEAADVVLSGAVTGSTGGKSAEALGGTKVEVLDSPTQVLIAQTTTASDGTYSVTVATGTYDVRVTPPSGSPFSPTTVANEEVNASKTLNFLLLGATDSTFSGTVKEASGAPAAGIRVQTWGPLDHGIPVERNSYTAADGTFSTSGLAPGKYEIFLSGQGVGHPSFWQFITYKTIDEDSSADFKLPPLVKVDVRVADQNGDPVPNTAIRLDGHATAYEMAPGLQLDPTSNSYSIADATTDSAGIAHMLMFPTDAAPNGGKATPSSGAYSQAVFAVPALTGDTTLDVTLVRSLSFSGTVKEASGAPAAGIRVQTWGPLDHGIPVERNSYTAADGTFSTSGLAPGKYEIFLSGQGVGHPSFWQFITYKTIDEDSSADFKLPPLVKVDVRVADQNGDPVPNTAIRLDGHATAYEMAPGLQLDPTSNSYSIADATTDSAGIAHMLMFPTDAAPNGGKATPSSGAYSQAVFAVPALTGDTTLDVTLVRSLSFSGTVKEASGAPAAGIRVQTWGPLDHGIPVERNSYTAADGTFSTSGLAPGKYEIFLSGQGVGHPSFWQFITYKTIDEDSSADFKLPPLVKVDVRVADQNGDPVPNTAIRLDGHATAYEMAPGLQLDPTSNSYSIADATTDSAGIAHMLMFPTDAAPNGGKATPSSGAYSQAVFAVPALTGDTTLAIALQSTQPPSPPLVNGVSPDTGAEAGGTEVTIAGTGFNGATAVRFGQTAASFTVNSPTLITATVPAGTGTVDVTVVTPSGTSSTNSSDRYRYGPSVTLSSAPNPSVRGAKVTFTAKVIPETPGAPVPTGSVTFVDGTTTLGTAVLSKGTAALNKTGLGAGVHEVVGVYGGNAYFGPSKSAPLIQTVTKASTQLTLTSSLNPAPYGSAGTLKATVKALAPGTGTPTGSVTFSEGETVLATVSLSAGSAKYALKAVEPGSHAITASFSGSTDYEPSKSSITQTVAKASTQLTLTSSLNPAPYGSSATLRAVAKAVAPGAGTPTGTVTFSEGSTVLATAPLSGTTAKYALKTLAPGNHDITATYSGDPHYGTSDASIAVTIAKAATKLTLTSSKNPAPNGSSGTLKATVKALAPGTGTPTGSVTFSEGETVLAVVPLKGSSAAYPLKSLAPGVHEITAAYGGSANYEASLAIMSQAINP